MIECIMYSRFKDIQ